MMRSIFILLALVSCNAAAQNSPQYEAYRANQELVEVQRDRNALIYQRNQLMLDAQENREWNEVTRRREAQQLARDNNVQRMRDNLPKVRSVENALDPQ